MAWIAKLGMENISNYIVMSSNYIVMVFRLKENASHLETLFFVASVIRYG